MAKKKKRTRKEALLETAEELNKVLGLEPAIETDDTTIAELEEKIGEAATLITEEDEFTKKTDKVLAEFIDEAEEAEEIDFDAIRDEVEDMKKRKDLRSYAKDNEDLFEPVVNDLGNLKSAKALKTAMLDHLDALQGIEPDEEPEEVEEAEEAEEAAEEKSEKKPKKKRGVIATIAQTIEDSGDEGVTKDEILEVLVEEFPNRDADSMANTINVQVPTRISKERFEVENVDGRYRKAE